MRFVRFALAAGLLLATAAPARADVTGFIGTTSTPSNRQVRGVAIGMGLLVVGFEFEYASTAEDLDEAAPGLRTGMGNLLLQTPFAVFGLQPYFTTGGGIYRESLGDASETQFGLNTRGGVKISRFGPVRTRVVYRVCRLRGEPLHDTVHRTYAGLNLRF